MWFIVVVRCTIVSTCVESLGLSIVHRICKVNGLEYDEDEKDKKQNRSLNTGEYMSVHC